jgi:hypothetical protein
MVQIGLPHCGRAKTCILSERVVSFWDGWRMRRMAAGRLVPVPGACNVLYDVVCDM